MLVLKAKGWLGVMPVIRLYISFTQEFIQGDSSTNKHAGREGCEVLTTHKAHLT